MEKSRLDKFIEIYNQNLNKISEFKGNKEICLLCEHYYFGRIKGKDFEVCDIINKDNCCINKPNENCFICKNCEWLHVCLRDEEFYRGIS